MTSSCPSCRQLVYVYCPSTPPPLLSPQEESARRLSGAVSRHCQQRHLQMPLQVAPDHPVEQVGRLLLAAVLRQTALHRRLAAFVTHTGQSGVGAARQRRTAAVGAAVVGSGAREER